MTKGKGVILLGLELIHAYRFRELIRVGQRNFRKYANLRDWGW